MQPTKLRVPSLLLAAVMSLSCSAKETVAPPVPVATAVRLSTSAITIDALGATEQITAFVTDQLGQPMASASLSWSATDATVATVTATGQVTAISVGTTQLTVRAGGVTGTATVTVRQVAATLQLTPSTVTFSSLSDTVRFVARVLDVRGNVLAASPTVEWSSSSGIAQVVGNGVVTSRGDGTATIRATAGNAVGTATVTVRQVATSVQVTPSTVTFTSLRDTVRFVARVLDARGNLLATPPTVEWSSSNSGAPVAGNGLVTSLGDGVGTIRATVGFSGLTGVAAVTVRQQVARLILSEASVLLTALFTGTGSVGSNELISAQAVDALGNRMSVQSPDFKSQNLSVVRLRNLNYGPFSIDAVGAGTTTVIVSLNGVSATANVEVRQLPQSIRLVNGFLSSRSIGQTIQIIAEVLDSGGSVIPMSNVSFTTLTPSILGVSPTGLVTALGLGYGQVRLQSGGISLIVNVSVF